MFVHEEKCWSMWYQEEKIEKPREDQGRIEIERQGLCFVKWLHWHTKQEGLRRYMLEEWTSCQSYKYWKPSRIMNWIEIWSLQDML